MLDSRSKSAVAMLVSSSDGLWRDGLLAAILFMALMVAVVVDGKVRSMRKKSRQRCWVFLCGIPVCD